MNHSFLECTVAYLHCFFSLALDKNKMATAQTAIVDGYFRQNIVNTVRLDEDSPSVT